MVCWDLRNLSLIMAWVHTILALIGALCFLVLLCCIDSEFLMEYVDRYDEKRDVLIASFSLIMILCLISLGLCVMLVLGIKQNRVKPMIPFVYLTCVSIVLGLLSIVAHFIMQLVHKDSFGDVFLNFLRNCLYVAFEVLLFSPIYLQYKKMRSCLLPPAPAPAPAENQGLSNNETTSKPNYENTGHI